MPRLTIKQRARVICIGSVGFYNYSLLKQTNRLENLLTRLEAQKSAVRVSQLTRASNSSTIEQLRGKHVVSNENNSLAIPRSQLDMCKVNLSSVNWMRIGYMPKAEDFKNETVLSRVHYGGLYKPVECRARERIAIIVSYRDREEHLEIFLNYMHAFLQQQKLQYGIYVVELDLPTQFNRGLLNNIGFETAQSIGSYDCYIFHDVDLLPKYMYNYYSCADGPVHFVARNMKYKFTIPYSGYIGGVFGITAKAFEKANGFSNLYFGWGREDDDLRERIYEAGYNIRRPEGRAGTYIALPHAIDASNPNNPARFQLYNEAIWRSGADGLNSLTYNRLALEFRDLYTWVYVQASEAAYMKDYQSWKERVKKNESTEEKE